MAVDVCRSTQGQVSKNTRTTEAWAELSQPLGIEIHWLGQLQHLQMLLKDLLPLLKDTNKNKANHTEVTDFVCCCRESPAGLMVLPERADP